MRKSGKGYQGNGWHWKSVGHGDGVDGKPIRMADCSEEHWESSQVEIFITAISAFPRHANDIKDCKNSRVAVQGQTGVHLIEYSVSTIFCPNFVLILEILFV